MKTYFIIIAILLCAACTKDGYNDFGLEDLSYEGTMWEYMSNCRKLDSMTVAIRRAGLIELFDTPYTGDARLTVFAISNQSANQFLFKTTDGNGNLVYTTISDIPVDGCKEMVLDYVIEGAYLLQDTPYEELGTLEGGLETNNMNGKKVRVYRVAGEDKFSPERLGYHAIDKGFMGLMQTTNIATRNGVIHVLTDKYQWNKF